MQTYSAVLRDGLTVNKYSLYAHIWQKYKNGTVWDKNEKAINTSYTFKLKSTQYVDNFNTNFKNKIEAKGNVFNGIIDDIIYATYIFYYSKKKTQFVYYW